MENITSIFIFHFHFHLKEVQVPLAVDFLCLEAIL